MNLYRVMIAEDEPHTARYIKAIVEESHLFTVVDVCESAEEALQLLPEVDVDVLITDIKMSGMTGLDLLRQIHLLRPAMRSIIISGYSSFDYAREAIGLGVSNYLLKPIDNEELVAALQEVYDSLEQQEQSSHEQYLSHLQQRSEQLLEGELQLPHGQYHALMVAGSFQQENLILRCENAFHIRQNDRLELLLYRYALVLLEVCDGDDTQERQLRKIANRIMAWETGSGNSGLLVISDLKIDSGSLGKELRQLYAFHQRNMSFGRVQMLRYHPRETEVSYDVAQEKNMIEQLIQNLNVRNEKDFRRNLCRLFAFWEENQSSLYSIKQAVYCIIIHLFQVDSNNIDPIIEINRVLRQLYTCADYEQAQDCIWNAVASLLERMHAVQSSSATQSQQMFWKIVEYLNMNIKRNFSLQELSDTFGISQPYVSKLFRMYSGNSYKEYITNRKIAMAISLMEQDRSIFIKDVAEQVGYDQLYFSTVFYRITGEYPKQYRERIWKQRENPDT